MEGTGYLWSAGLFSGRSGSDKRNYSIIAFSRHFEEGQRNFFHSLLIGAEIFFSYPLTGTYIIGSHGSQAFRLGLAFTPLAFRNSSLQMSDNGTSQSS